MDCLGGLREFNNRKIKTYASELTIQLAKKNHFQDLPSIPFQKKLILDIGKDMAMTEFFGPGHTYDNVVSYIPKKKCYLEVAL